jgi:hypothetical protein
VTERTPKENGELLIKTTTLIPIGVVVMLVSAAVWINNTLTGLRADFVLETQKINSRLDSIEANAKASADALVAGDRWTKQDMMHWIALTSALNPALKLPEAMQDVEE